MLLSQLEVWNGAQKIRNFTTKLNKATYVNN
jgi:hypothetical protein